MLANFEIVFGAVVLGIMSGSGALHLIPRLGRAGAHLSDILCRAPGLDLVITYFIALPLILGPAFAGWAGLLGAIAGQVASVVLWTLLHELIHRKTTRGPRIVKVVSRLVGPWRNHVGLCVTAVVAPGFWLVRVAQLISYMPLTVIVGLPAHRQRDWVNVSRHKFAGLVGHDLIWCLYCDWMTGVWSLGSEMLRNVESLWCPIRFVSGKKCENCAVDFPDIKDGWVPADGTMQQVSDTLVRMYSDGRRSWYGRRVQLTINEKPAGAGPGNGALSSKAGINAHQAPSAD